ncbi:MAG: SsrA-binding protein SmpB [Patescibacteria group bacterium]|nr:SsrA-binding protein SmpB [Patescibacteria group bacterium]MCL5224089.1 SsrA-binding protein SmpB [Patescibacteria group bacterium]
MSELAANRRAYHDYAVLEKFEAGIELHGHEVKAIKSGRVNIAGAHVALRGGEAWLIGADVPPYQPKNTPASYKPQRDRRLLLNRKEINLLLGRIKEKGLTAIPLRIYTARGKLGIVKLEIGLVRPRNKADKREFLKKQEFQKEIRNGGASFDREHP